MSVVFSMEKKLQLNEDMPHHKRAWKIKRIAWGVMSFIILLAILGLMGGEGVLSKQELVTEDYKIEYEKYLRYKKNYELKFEIKNNPADTLFLEINNNYIDNFEIQDILPEPYEQVISGDDIKYSFLNEEDLSNIKFVLNPMRVKKVKAEIKVNDKEVSINQIIYP